LNCSKNSSRRESPLRVNPGPNSSNKLSNPFFNIPKGVHPFTSTPTDFFTNSTDAHPNIMSLASENDGIAIASTEKNYCQSNNFGFPKDINLKLQVQELENENQRLQEINKIVVSYNKELETKVGFHQKKVQIFNDVYNQVIGLINNIFKKVGDFLLDNQNLKENNSAREDRNSENRQYIKQKLNFLFMNEITDLKFIFKNVQNNIDAINEELISQKVSDDTGDLPQFSKLIDPTIYNPFTMTNDYSSLGKRMPSTHTWKNGKENVTDELPMVENKHINLEASKPLTSRENTLRTDPYSSRPDQNPLDDESGNTNYKHQFFEGNKPSICYHKKPIYKVSLRDKISKRIADEKSGLNSKPSPFTGSITNSNNNNTKKFSQNTKTTNPSTNTSILPDNEKKRSDSAKPVRNDHLRSEHTKTPVEKSKTLSKNDSLKFLKSSTLTNLETAFSNKNGFDTNRDNKSIGTERSNMFTDRFYQENFNLVSNNESINQDTLKTSRQNSYENIKVYRNMKDNFHLDITNLQKYKENKLKKYGFYKEFLTLRENLK
jgi:hypothetical protein